MSEPRAIDPSKSWAHFEAAPAFGTSKMDVDGEVKMLVEEIGRLGEKQESGRMGVKFVTLFEDERCLQLFEALVGTLRAAKRKKVITFEGEMLLKGVHDDTLIEVL